MLPPPVFILRHGETTWNASGRLQGHHDAPLTKRGQAQAVQQGRILARYDLSGHRLISSPQGRAVRTAQIALGPRAGQIEIDPALAEIGLGQWAGEDRASLMAQTGAVDGFALYDLAPAGEGMAALRTRCEAFLATLKTPSVLITHGITSRMLRLVLTGHSGCDVRVMSGGQGIVYYVASGIQTRLTEGA